MSSADFWDMRRCWCLPLQELGYEPSCRPWHWHAHVFKIWALESAKARLEDFDAFVAVGKVASDGLVDLRF